ncbi:MAG: 4Fe-4S dicluster domain-containing protein [Syntrophaceae bacterium]
MPLKITASENRLRQEIELACGVDLDLCYECGKCSGGCPTGHHFDFTPRKIIQMIRLGDVEFIEAKLLQMDALSICVSCRLCLERCPSGIDTPKIIDYLREAAVKREIAPKRPAVDLFNRLFLGEIARRGRVSELFLLIRYKVKTGNLWSDFGTGIRLFFKGKLNPFTPGVKAGDQVRKALKGL